MPHALPTCISAQFSGGDIELVVLPLLYSFQSLSYSVAILIVFILIVHTFLTTSFQQLDSLLVSLLQLNCDPEHCVSAGDEPDLCSRSTHDFHSIFAAATKLASVVFGLWLTVAILSWE